MVIKMFSADMLNLYIIWTYKYPRKNVRSSKLTNAVPRNLKKNIYELLNFIISVYFMYRNFLSEQFKGTLHIYSSITCNIYDIFAFRMTLCASTMEPLTTKAEYIAFTSRFKFHVSF